MDFQLGSPLHQYLEKKFTALDERLDGHSKRISLLEQWRGWIMGGLAVVGLLATGLFQYVGIGLKILFSTLGVK